MIVKVDLHFFSNTKHEGTLKANTRQVEYSNSKKIVDSYISVPQTLDDS